MFKEAPLKKILIVDDEKLARTRIRRFLTELHIHAEIEEAKDGLEALESIKSYQPEVVFLDIQLPGMNGFEVLQQIEKKEFHLIFQTAFDEFAIRAFEENACDYLLKPFPKERFEKALLKALNSKTQKAALEKLEHQLKKTQGSLEKIAVRSAGKTKILELGQVDCFVSRDHYTCIYSNSLEIISDLSLNWLEERLNAENFVRCHRNSIVALDQIKNIGDSTHSHIELKNGMKLPLSRGNRKKVFSLFQ